MKKTKKTKFCQMIENAISNSSIAGRPPNSDFLIGFWSGENLPFFPFFTTIITITIITITIIISVVGYTL